jgi:CBS domain-containing protein
MFEIETIMTTDVITVTRHTPITRVLEIMSEHDVTGLPVVNSDMTLAGIISEKDLLTLISDQGDSPAQAEDFMTDDIVSFDQDDDLIAVCECLTNNHFRRVPIVSQGVLVGIVSRRDIIKYMMEPI